MITKYEFLSDVVNRIDFNYMSGRLPVEVYERIMGRVMDIAERDEDGVTHEELEDLKAGVNPDG